MNNSIEAKISALESYLNKFETIVQENTGIKQNIQHQIRKLKKRLAKGEITYH